MVIVGHRGTPHEQIENSWSGFEFAVKNNVKRIETDIQVSKDGICFIIHDENLERLTGEDVLLTKTNSKDLEKLKLKDGSQIPKLTELLIKFNNKLEWNLEIKSKTTKEADIIIKEIVSAEVKTKIIISSFHHALIEHLITKHPEFEYALLWEELPEDLSIIEQKMIALNTKIIHPEFDLIDNNFLRLCREKSWDIVPYISMSKEELSSDYIEKLKSFKLAGMCTNFPIQLQTIFNEK